MRGIARHVVAFVVLCANACGTGDVTVDPGDLELRDLLGVAPEVARGWDAEQRAAARRMLVDALDAAHEPVPVELRAGASLDERVSRTLALLDGERFAAGDRPLAIVRVELDADKLVAIERAAPTVAATTSGGTAPVVTLDTTAWGTLSPRALEVLAAVASDTGHERGPVIAVPAARLPVIASYIAQPPRLLVNPVLVAALDPAYVELPTAARSQSASSTTAVVEREPAARSGGNPYSFYGSVAECAYAQRLRCDSCTSGGECKPVTNTSDGVSECTTLEGGNGRGFFLLCINLSLAITSVNSCAAEAVSGCGRDDDAASDLNQLEANAMFLDDATCAAGLDGCLAKIYGAPKNPFPGIVDGGVDPPDPPRETNVSCGDSCSDDNSNCDASPSCNCDGPSCNNSFSCDSTCSSSNSQSGCGDNCDSCSSSDSGGSSGGGGCSSDSGGGSSSGGGCSSDSGGGSSSGGDCGGGDCGGDCGGGDCGGDCGGGGSGGCQVARKAPSPVFALALSLVWGVLPVPVAAWLKRRGRRRARASGDATDADVKEEAP